LVEGRPAEASSYLCVLMSPIFPVVCLFLSCARTVVSLREVADLGANNGVESSIFSTSSDLADQSIVDATTLCESSPTGPAEDWRSKLPQPTGTVAQNDNRRMTHPLERLVLCSNGKGYVFKIEGFMSAKHELTSDEIKHLFRTMLSAWPQGPRHRTAAQDGNFLFLLDVDANLIVAPVMQMEMETGNFEEVKHGDLGPGKTPWEHGTPFGDYRGTARLGGEFDLAGDRSGASWVVHQKSGYSLNRASVDKLKQWHEKMKDTMTDIAIWGHAKSCVKKDKPVGLEGLSLLLEYMHSNWGVEMVSPRLGYRCSFTDPDVSQPALHGSLPRLDKCSQASVQQELATGPSDSVEVKLAEWYAPSTCNKTPWMISSQLGDFNESLQTIDGKEYRTLNKNFQSLRKSGCWTDESFQTLLKCDLFPCDGYGFYPYMRIGSKLSLSEFRATWEKHNPYKEFLEKCV